MILYFHDSDCIMPDVYFMGYEEEEENDEEVEEEEEKEDERR